MRATSDSSTKSMSAGRSRIASAAARELRHVGGLTEGDAHALEHDARLVLGDRVLERDVAGDEPHEVVAGLVLEAGLVAGVGLEQAAARCGRWRCP